MCSSDLLTGFTSKIILVYLNVRSETSKVRTSRRVVSRGGEYFQRLNSRVKPKASDFVFSEVGGDKRLSIQKWYMHWKKLMFGIGVTDYQERKLTWYSLRHFGITCRVRSKVPYLDIAKIAGTSGLHIQNTYSHYDDDMLKSTALKNFAIDKNGIVLSNE